MRQERGGQKDNAACKPPPLEMLRCAITAPSTLDNGGNYESLETLGDAFLKFAVSAHVFCTHRSYHQGQLSVLKDTMVGNCSLFKAALRLGIERRVRVAPMPKEGGKVIPSTASRVRSK